MCVCVCVRVHVCMCMCVCMYVCACHHVVAVFACMQCCAHRVCPWRSRVGVHRAPCSRSSTTWWWPSCRRPGAPASCPGVPPSPPRAALTAPCTYPWSSACVSASWNLACASVCSSPSPPPSAAPFCGPSALDQSEASPAMGRVSRPSRALLVCRGAWIFQGMMKVVGEGRFLRSVSRHRPQHGMTCRPVSHQAPGVERLGL